MAPLVSVITPVRNGRPHIPGFMDSMLWQKLEDFELIIAEDGSTDGSYEMLEEYSRRDPRVKVIKGAVPGVSGARNSALEAATGEFVAFIDCDDRAFPEWLLKMYEAIKAADADMAVCGYMTKSAGNSRLSDEEKKLEAAVIEPRDAAARILTYRDLTSALWNKMMRRSTIEEGAPLRFDTDISIGEDLLFISSYLVRSKRVVTVPDALYIYSVGGSSAMSGIVRDGQWRREWLTEWTAILGAQEILEKRWPHMRETDIKKVRVAGKLLRAMRKYSYKDSELKGELREVLRNNWKTVLTEPEFGAAMKMRMLREMVSER